MKNRIKLNISSVAQAIKKIRDIRKPYIRVLFGNAILQAARPFIPIILSAKILDELLGAKVLSTLLTLAFLLVGFMFVTHIISGYFTKKYGDESKMLINQYYFELSKKSMKMSYDYIERKETTDLLHQIEGASNSSMAIWNIAEYLQKGTLAVIEILIAISLILTMFTSASSVAVSGEMSFIQSPLTFGALMVILLFGLYLYSVLQGKLGKTAANDMKGQVGGNRIFGYLFFHMSNNYENGKDIRLYNAQNLIHSKMRKFVEGNYYECDEFFVKPNIKHFSLLNIVNVMMLVTVYIFIILKAYVGAITVGAIFIQINAIMKLYGSVGSLLNQYNMLKAACEHFKYSIEFFNLPETKRLGRKKINMTEGCVIKFENVSFKYPASESLVLENLNLTITPSERLAVVGMNGAGKTTMIKLICRLYDPTEGKITLNDVDINEYDFDEYIDMFAVVFQDFKLFSFGMDRNIASNDIVRENELVESLKHAGLSNILEELNGKLDVSIGKNYEEHGRDFSGGEKQKLAIARALYKDSPIVILDEPTAALDPIAEYEVYTKFNTLVADKTAIFISHRLSSCKFCHNIVVFDKGNVVQFGNHDTLVADKNGKYFELWSAQAEHYIVS